MPLHLPRVYLPPSEVSCFTKAPSVLCSSYSPGSATDRMDQCGILKDVQVVQISSDCIVTAEELT